MAAAPQSPTTASAPIPPTTAKGAEAEATSPPPVATSSLAASSGQGSSATNAAAAAAAGVGADATAPTSAPAPASPKPVPTSPETKTEPSASAAASAAAAAPTTASSGSVASSTSAPQTSTSASTYTDDNDADDEASSEPLPDDPEGIINMEIFSQIQDMDEDDDDEAGGHEFSKGIVWGYFEQAENTFKQMEEAIAEPSLWKLSSLGHFLKGSSAALGIVKVQNSCEKMQHYGNLRDEEVGAALSEEEALKRIKHLLVDCKRDYGVASRWLRRLYGDDE